jgi:hypothetical protein
MKKTKPATRKPIAKLKKPYEGGDALMEWHKEKMKSTLHDADYATAMWRCENDWDRTKDYLTWIAMWAVLLGTLYLLVTWFEGVAP